MTDETQQAERIEQAALLSLHETATPVLKEALGLEAFSSGTALASIAGRLPTSAIAINRVLGLGVDEPASRAQVDELVERYQAAGVKRFFVQRHPEAQPPELADWLLEAGLERARGWQKFERGMEPARRVESPLSIRRIGPEHGQVFAQIACDAFDLGEMAVPWLAGLAGRGDWHIFMSFEGDEPVGTGALFVNNGCGWTDFGATSPRFRQRGSQAALLAARIDYARELGCRALISCTGEAVPGDPQHSYGNLLKAGFRETYIKENYAPARE